MGTLGKAIYTVGFWIRETGQAIDRLGSRLQGNYYFQEQRNYNLHSLLPRSPLISFIFIFIFSLFNYIAFLSHKLTVSHLRSLFV